MCVRMGWRFTAGRDIKGERGINEKRGFMSWIAHCLCRAHVFLHVDGYIPELNVGLLLEDSYSTLGREIHCRKTSTPKSGF